MEFIIPKTELEKNSQLSHQLTQLCAASKELPDHCLYVPRADQELAFVKHLLRHRLVYAVQYGDSRGKGIYPLRCGTISGRMGYYR